MSLRASLGTAMTGRMGTRDSPTSTTQAPGTNRRGERCRVHCQATGEMNESSRTEIFLKNRPRLSQRARGVHEGFCRWSYDPAERCERITAGGGRLCDKLRTEKKDEKERRERRRRRGGGRHRGREASKSTKGGRSEARDKPGPGGGACLRFRLRILSPATGRRSRWFGE